MTDFTAQRTVQRTAASNTGGPEVAFAIVLGFVAVAAGISGVLNPLLWDDLSILGDRLAPGGCDGILSLWRTPYWGRFGPPDTYRPLGLSVLYVERLVFGVAPLGYRCVSMTLHAAVSLTAGWVLCRLGGRRVGLVCALLFAAHPIHAEAIAMAYGQLELLAALFAMLSIGTYDLATRGRLRGWLYVFSVICAAAAAAGKESGVMVPALLLVVRAARVSESDQGRVLGRGRLLTLGANLLRGLHRDLAYWAVAAAFLFARHRVLGTWSSAAEATVAMDYPLWIRLKLVVVSAGEAVRLCILPMGQTLYYGHLRDSLFGLPVYEAAWLAGAIAAVWLCLSDMVRPRLVWMAVAWFVFTFFPVSNVIPSGVVVAERALYLPSLGVCLLAAGVLDGLLPGRRAIAAAGALAAIGVLAGNLAVRNWRDELTLWRSTVAAHPRSPQGQLLLGKALVSRWDARPAEPIPPAEFDEAEHAFRAAAELGSSDVEALNGLGIVALRRGDLKAAEQHFAAALNHAPGDPTATRGLRLVRERLTPR